VVEIIDRNELTVHRDTAAAVDAILRGMLPSGEHREQGADGQIHVREKEPPIPPSRPAMEYPPQREGPLRVYPYALSRDLLERVIRSLHLDARSVGDPEQADLVLALRSRSDDPRLKRMTDGISTRLLFIKRNTANEMRRAMEKVFQVLEGAAEDEAAELVEEIEAALVKLRRELVEVPLAPQPPLLRKMQHRIISGQGFLAQSTGREPNRHLVIYPLQAE